MTKRTHARPIRDIAISTLRLATGGALLIVETELEAKADKRKQSLYFPETL